jgi:hypothetical protein
MGGSGAEVGQPPPPDPNAPPATGSTPTTLVMRKIFLGDTDTQGQPSSTAWRSYGLNVDGLVSTKNSTNHCAPQKGGVKSSVQTDGDNGIDNSFGSNVLKIILSLSPDPTQELSAAIASGSGTWLIHLANLGAPAAQNGVQAALFGAAPVGAPPAWSGGDLRPPTFESVSGGDITKPLVTFPQSYVVGGVWVGSPPANAALDLNVDTQGFGLTFRIRRARVVATIVGTGPAATATGVVSGVLDTEEYLKQLQQVAGSFDQTLCEGSTWESVAQAFRAASDIMKDGTNGDPSKTCDGISIGLAFEATAAKLGPVAGPVPPPPDYCK